MASSLRFREVTRRFGEVLALDRLTLEVTPGQVVALLGSSGSGKTTALRLVNRLLEPGSGEVWLDDLEIGRCDPILLRRRIGYVIQEGGLFPHWTARDNVALVPRLCGWPEERVLRRVGEAMELAQIPVGQFGKRYPSSLSGGQRQRVAFARAVAGQPDLLLLDEPFGALDPVTRDTLHGEFRAWHAGLGTTTVLVTHDVVEAFKLADRIAVLHHGRLLQVGPPVELVLRPAHPQVSHLLGPSSLELRLRFLTLDQVLPELPSAPGLPAVELDGSSTLAEGLEAMARERCEALVVRRSGATPAGPVSRSDLWSLLRCSTS
ncbi:MAG: ABC transporter ATP-binding protein [Candidatus Eremiobacterota bacterium]